MKVISCWKVPHPAARTPLPYMFHAGCVLAEHHKTPVLQRSLQEIFFPREFLFCFIPL
jgi:hypothetical protein